MDLLPQNMIELLQPKYSPLKSIYANLEVFWKMMHIKYPYWKETI